MTISGPAVQAAVGFLLAAFFAAQMRNLAVLFDHPFSFVAEGAALLGLGAAWLPSGPASDSGSGADRRGMAGLRLAGAALAMGAFQVLAVTLPQGPLPSFLLLVAMLALPAWCGARGVRLLAEGRGPLAPWGLGAAAGLLLSPAGLDRLGGAVPAGWVAALGLGLCGLAVGGRRRLGVRALAVVALAVAAGIFAREGARGLPPFTAGSRERLKPVFAELDSSGKAVLRRTRSDSFARTDVVEFPGRDDDLLWIFTDGTAPVPVPTGTFVSTADEAWLERFPLVSLPILFARPDRVLTVGAVRGPEVLLAAHLGATVEAWSHNPTAERLRAGIAGGDPGAGSPVSVHFGDVRASLRSREDSFGLIFLPLCHTGRSAWLFSHAAEGRLFTREAFSDYWQRLGEGGYLAVTTRDERLFARMLLTVWEALREDLAGANPALGLHAWGMRLSPRAPSPNPYRHLLLVKKGSIDPEDVERLRDLGRTFPIEVLFGPGAGSRPPYSALEERDGAAATTEALRRALSPRTGVWLDLEPPTDRRPFPFHLVRDPHPFLRGLLAATVALLIGILLFPLSSRRRMGAPGGAALPPLPVFLGSFAALGVALSLGVIGALGWATVSAGSPVADASVLLAGVVWGFAAGTGRWSERMGVVSLGAPLAGAALAGVCLLFAEPALAPGVGGPALARRSLLAALGAGLGVASSAPATFLASLLGEALPGLLPWARLALGSGALGATALVPYLLPLGGWGTVWAGAAVSFALAFPLGLWSRAGAYNCRM